jgi:tRNA threonylcarbamoyladenosine modification (KEOPS) complex Cgi121 subunit
MKGTDNRNVQMGKMQIESVPQLLTTLREIQERYSVWIVCMNAAMMAGRPHAEEAIRQALLAEEEGTMTARTFEMEVLLYVSGQRQTSLAMKFGLHEGEMTTWVGMIPYSDEAWIALAEYITLIPDEEKIPPERISRLQELFGITGGEIDTVGSGRIDELVIERTALLNIIK